jgi:hypothetical protein
MGKKFGLLSIIFGIASICLIVLLYPIGFFRWAPESYYFILIFIIFIIILGGIGIFKDESRGSGIGGVVLGVVAVVLWIVFPIIFSS